MPFTKGQIEELVRSVPCWHNSIDLGHGVVTPGRDSAQMLAAMRLPDLRGKTVLDIGAGEGRWRAELRRMRPAIRYVGVDPSEYVVARHGQRRNIRLRARISQGAA